MIKTNLFSLTRGEFFKIIAINRIKNFWFIYLFSFYAAFHYSKDFGEDKFASFMVIFGIGYLFLMFFYLYYWTWHPYNRIFYNKHYFLIDDYKITTVAENGDKSEMDFLAVVKQAKRDNYWLLYISASQFIYVPKDAFKSPEDVNRFEAIMENKKWLLPPEPPINLISGENA